MFYAHVSPGSGGIHAVALEIQPVTIKISLQIS